MNWKHPTVYAVRHKDEIIRAASRSGGVFTALSNRILEDGGIVYGCVLTEKFEAVHIRAENAVDRDKMRGSKYIQSKIGNMYRNVKNDLLNDRKVLFSGTSCQIAGLRSFLGKEYDNLFCVDIVCHGVPSPKVWEAYLLWQERRANAKVKSVDFRNKRDFGWRDHVETVSFDNDKVFSSRVFKNLFYGHTILRQSCYECPYKSVIHPGDVTIADYWGIEKAAPEFDDNKGVSLVLVNNEIGDKIFNEVKGCLAWKQTRLEDSLQLPLQAPFPMPHNREQFWKDFYEQSFEYVAKEYGGYGLVSKIRNNLRRIKKKIKIKVGGQ